MVSPELPPDEVYTSRAKAHWGYYGSGSIGPGTIYIYPPGTPPSGFAWTGDEDARTVGPEVWSPVTDGSQPPELLPKAGEPDRKRFNEALRTNTFS